jgi:hypothetical protein
VPRLPKAAFVVNNNPPRATLLLFCFGSLVAHSCTLAKTESVCPPVAGVASPQELPTLTQALHRNHRSQETRLDHHPFLLNLKHRVRSKQPRGLRVQRDEPANSASTHLRLADLTLVPRPLFFHPSTLVTFRKSAQKAKQIADLRDVATSRDVCTNDTLSSFDAYNLLLSFLSLHAISPCINGGCTLRW